MDLKKSRNFNKCKEIENGILTQAKALTIFTVTTFAV